MSVNVVNSFCIPASDSPRMHRLRSSMMIFAWRFWGRRLAVAGEVVVQMVDIGSGPCGLWSWTADADATDDVAAKLK